MMYKCDDCHKEYKQKYNLSKHRLSHQNAKNDCKECGASFSSELALRRHMSTHSTLHQCPFCAKTFSLK